MPYASHESNARYFLLTAFGRRVALLEGNKSMAEHGYTELPALTIGGPTGDYFIQCPIISCQWAEYAIDSIVNGDGGTGAVVVSTENSKPSALDYTGIAANKFSDDAVYKGVPYRVPATTTQPINSAWERIVNSQKRVYVRIDAAASTSLYVTLRFRIKDLATIPAPSTAGHHDAMELVNRDRESRIKERLGQMQIPPYADELSGVKSNT